MKLNKFLSNLSFLTVLALSVSTPLCAESKDAPSFSPEQMEAYTKATTPGAEHAMLQKYVGKWRHVASFWMKPDGKPEVSEGNSEIKSIMDGRFIKHQVWGVSMGRPFEGLGITGYDNVQKKFSTIWIDNMGTGMMIGNGQIDKGDIQEKGSFSCPFSPTGSMPYRAVWGKLKGDSFTYEMYTTDESGKEFRMMEIRYTKAR